MQDFVPVLISILMGMEFNGFSLWTNEGSENDFYYFTDLPAGEVISFQCKDKNGNFITVRDHVLDGKNYNEGFDFIPVRRADFNNIFNASPEACLTTTLIDERKWIFEGEECSEFISTTHRHSYTYRVIHNGTPLNIWNTREELKFIDEIEKGNTNLRLIASLADEDSFNESSFYRNSFQNYSRPLVGGEYDPVNKKACFWDQADLDANGNKGAITITLDQAIDGYKMTMDLIENGVDLEKIIPNFLVDNFANAKPNSINDNVWAGDNKVVIRKPEMKLWGVSVKNWVKAIEFIKDRT